MVLSEQFYKKKCAKTLFFSVSFRDLYHNRLCLFYKIVYGLVAIPMPDYIHSNNRVSRYCHSITYRQIHTGANYYKYSFFPLAIVQWNALPEEVVLSRLQHL